jgi:dTDP-4-amino-4,6-dideoxygalactose transaminase
MSKQSEPFIPVAQPDITEEDALFVAEAVRSGWVSNGPMIRRFESEFAAAVGAKHAIAVNNGTAALQVSLAALRVGPGDEVIVPSLTFISSANVVLYLGAKPVLVECDPATLNVTAEIIEAAITPKTKAIMPVEMNGIALDYAPLLELSKKHNIPIVADSAEALGSEYRGTRVGSQAPIHCFSFFPNKSITTGEGGMVTCSDDAMAERIGQLVNQGQDGRYNHVVLGFNFRMTEMQAALGISQLSRLGEQLHRKEKLALYYDQHLAGIPGLELAPRPEWSTAQSWYMYSVIVKDLEKRDQVVDYLMSVGVDTRLGFPPIHNQPYYRETFGYTADDLPISMKIWERKIDLPSWPKMSEDERKRVVAAVKEAMISEATDNDLESTMGDQ